MNAQLKPVGNPIPYSLESEQAVIGSIFEDPSIMNKIAFLEVGDFYVKQHQMIYRAMLDEHDKGNEIDMIIISDIVGDECGGIAYLADIMKMKSSVSNVVAYARRVMDYSMRRKSIGRFYEAIDDLHHSSIDVVDCVSKLSEDIDEQISRTFVSDALTIDDLTSMSLDEMEKSMLDNKLGLSTGIEEVDCQLGYMGMAYGEVTFLGALSKNGKTLFANTITARCNLDDDESCLVFSIEMPSLGMFNGIVSAMSGVPNNFFSRQKYYLNNFPNRYDEWMAKWGNAVQDLNASGKIEIIDKKSVTMDYICAEMKKKCASLKSKGKKLKLVVIDHFHRIEFNDNSKAMTYVMGDAVRKLKNTAAELNLAVLLLGQLNESCKDKDPTGFDILDTSRIRQEVQAFIGTRIFREDGMTFFGVYSDAHRYGDHETVTEPKYMRLAAGVLRSLPDDQKYWRPKNKNEDAGRATRDEMNKRVIKRN